MKKSIVVLLVCLMATGLLACGDSEGEKKENGSNINTAFGVDEKTVEINLQKLKEQYETQALKDSSGEDEFKGFKRILLSDAKSDSDTETNRAGIFTKDRVIRSFITCKVEKNNVTKFKELSKILFTNMIPNFKEYESWLDSMVLVCVENPKKEFHWDKDSMNIRLKFDKSSLLGDTISIDITEAKEELNMFEEADSLGGTEIVELDKEGNIPKNMESKSNSIELNNDKLFDDIFTKIPGNLTFEETKTWLDKASVKYQAQDKSKSPVTEISMSAGGKSKDSVNILFREKDGKEKISIITYLRSTEGLPLTGSVMYEEGTSYSGPNNESLESFSDIKRSLFK